MNNGLQYKFVQPDKSLSDFVYCFSLLQNLSGVSDGVIIPNGKIDLHFSKTRDSLPRVSLVGLETKPKPFPKQNNDAVIFSISFNPLAVEYVLRYPIAGILNSGKMLANDFWDFSTDDLDDFDALCKKVSQKIRSLLPEEVDERKRKLFEFIFEANGEMSVKALAEKVFWSARQINQYFNQQFGLSLKAYCSILRFQASLEHIKEGRLFPQLNYYDQSHFIKEIKRLSGASPKELFKNQNSRFLQFLHTGAK